MQNNKMKQIYRMNLCANFTLKNGNQCTWRHREKIQKLSTRFCKGWFGSKYGTNLSNKWSNILIFGISVEEKKEKYGKKNMLTYTHTHFSMNIGISTLIKAYI